MATLGSPRSPITKANHIHYNIVCFIPTKLGDTLPLAYAKGLAEDYARHLGVARLVEAEAPRRQHLATEKQTALLHKLGVATRQGLTKGEAADLLAAVLGDCG
jgi:hypothetical protein